jgi:Flp pilus assembly protein TadG
MNFFRNNRGAAAVEFALVSIPVMLFIIGIMQTAWIVWANNLLDVSVNVAARCGAVQSTTSPCNGSGLANMQSTANTVFGLLSGATFSDNATCTADSGSGLIGTYNVSIAFVVNLTLTAKPCYPSIS